MLAGTKDNKIRVDFPIDAQHKKCLKITFDTDSNAIVVYPLSESILRDKIKLYEELMQALAMYTQDYSMVVDVNGRRYSPEDFLLYLRTNTQPEEKQGKCSVA
jgi:hypothetical protein